MSVGRPPLRLRQQLERLLINAFDAQWHRIEELLRHELEVLPDLIGATVTSQVGSFISNSDSLVCKHLCEQGLPSSFQSVPGEKKHVPIIPIREKNHVPIIPIAQFSVPSESNRIQDPSAINELVAVHELACENNPTSTPESDELPCQFSSPDHPTDTIQEEDESTREVNRKWRRASTFLQLEDSGVDELHKLVSSVTENFRTAKETLFDSGDFTCLDLIARRPEGHRRFLRHFVDGPLFLTISSCVIMANVFYIGIETELRMSNEFTRLETGLESQLIVTNDVTEYFFTMFFVVELAMKLVGKKFHLLNDFAWTVFDTLVVVSSIIELFSGDETSLAVCRIIRIFRLVRLLKVIRRTPVLASLNMMVIGIITSFIPLLWATLILFLVIYVFSIFLMVLVTNFLSGKVSGQFLTQIETLKNIYGSMPKVMAVFFEAASGGDDWSALSQPLCEINASYYTLFVVYIIFVTLGVLNIVTGFFVEGTIQCNITSREELINDDLQIKRETAELLRLTFEQMDHDQSGVITRDELQYSLQDITVLEQFGVLEIDNENLKRIFDMIDIRQTGEVNIDEFVDAIMQTTKSLSCIDLWQLVLQGRYIIEMLSALSKQRRTGILTL